MIMTALEIVKQVFRKLGLDSSITGFSEANESQWLLDSLNERYSELLRLLPSEMTYSEVQGSINVLAGQRLYSPPADLYLPQLYDWSILLNNTDSTLLEYANLEEIVNQDPKYQVTQSSPCKVYIEAGKIGLYPVPIENAMLSFIYRKRVPQLTLPTDELLVPEEWLAYIKLGMEFDYQIHRGQGQPDITLMRMGQHFSLIASELFRLKQTQFKSH